MTNHMQGNKKKHTHKFTLPIIGWLKWTQVNILCSVRKLAPDSVLSLCYLIHTCISAWLMKMWHFSILSDNVELFTQVWAQDSYSEGWWTPADDYQPFLSWNSVHSCDSLSEWRGKWSSRSSAILHYLILFLQ